MDKTTKRYLLAIGVWLIFMVALLVDNANAGWVSGEEVPLPEDHTPVNPYVYLPADNNPSPLPNTDATLVVSGWSNLFYQFLIEDADVSRSKVLRSYYRSGKPECHQFTLRLTFVPKRGTVIMVERTCALYPPQFDEENPNAITARISQFSSRQEQMTKLIKTMETMTVQLVDCEGRVMDPWVFQLSGARDALAEIER